MKLNNCPICEEKIMHPKRQGHPRCTCGQDRCVKVWRRVRAAIFAETAERPTRMRIIAKRSAA